MDPGHRIQRTHIFSLNDFELSLHLLGGAYNRDGEGYMNSNTVWRLEWNDSNSSYFWTHELVPAMGEFYFCWHLIKLILTGHYFGESTVAAVPDNFLTAFYKP